MAGPFEFDTPTLSSFTVLIIMSCVYLALGVLLRRKTRAVESLPKEMSPNIFNKTFNVFDPYPEHRKMIGLTPLLVIAAAMVPFLAFFVAPRLFQSGATSGLVLLIVCLALMMIDEVHEVYRNAGMFVEAIDGGKGLGKGDLATFQVVKKSLRTLTTYYFSLAAVLFVSSLVLPYIMPVAASAFNQFIRLVFENTAGSGLAGIYVAMALYAATIVAIQLCAGKMRSKVFGFPPSESLASIDLQFDQIRSYAKMIMHKSVNREARRGEKPRDEKKD